MLISPHLVHTGFRVICGLSPHMYESCWYDTNIPNLWSYLKNRLNNLVMDKEADVRRALAVASDPNPAASFGRETAFPGEMAKAQKVEAK